MSFSQEDNPNSWDLNFKLLCKLNIGWYHVYDLVELLNRMRSLPLYTIEDKA